MTGPHLCDQEEVKKLKTDEDVHKDLTQRFEAVSGELKSTKDKLAATLTQLADSSTSASASERSVQDATEKLQVVGFISCRVPGCRQVWTGWARGVSKAPGQNILFVTTCVKERITVVNLISEH